MASQVNFKDVATAMSMRMLKYLYNQAKTEHAVMIIEWARKRGANIAPGEENAAISELVDMLPEPGNWPQLELNPVSGQISTNAKAPKIKDGDDSDKATSRKAADFGELKLPEGVEVTCPVETKSGARKGQPCGRKCTRVLDEHDPSDPRCASFKCEHMYCSMHVAKVGKMDSTLALARLEKAKDAKAAPIVATQDGKTTVVDTKMLGELEPADNTVASSVMAKLLSKVAKRTE